MPSVSRYLDDWLDAVHDGLRSYSDVAGGLRRSREYHRSRSMPSPDDMDAEASVPRIEIPLLWGTF